MSTMELPQHMVALARANEVREAHAELKRTVARLEHGPGYAMVADILEDRAGPAARMRLGQLLLAVRQVGPRQVWRFMRDCGIATRDVYVAQLTVRQRRALVDVLRREAERLTRGS